MRATRRLITRRFAWKGMAADVAAWTKDCQQCQRGEVTAQPAAAVEPIPVPARRFSHIHVDQRRYSAFDRELLACSSGIRHYRHMLDGRPFAVYTDHKPLTFALSRATDAWTPRQGRHVSYVAEFTADIRYIPGKENVVAIPCPGCQGPPTLPDWIAAPTPGQHRGRSGDSARFIGSGRPGRHGGCAAAVPRDDAATAHNLLQHRAAEDSWRTTSL